MRSNVAALVVAALLSAPTFAQAPAPGAERAAPALPDLPNSRAKVPWGDFLRILEELRKAQPPVKEPPEPPRPYAIGRSQLVGTLAADGKSMTVEATVDITVLSPEQWAEVPLFGDDVAVAQAALGDRPATLYPKNGQLHLAMRGKGTSTLKATFAVRVAESAGTRTVSFRYWQAPASSFELRLPDVELEVTPSPGVVAMQREEGGKTTALVALPAGGQIHASWRKKSREATAAEPGAGKTHAEVRTLVTVGEGVMSAQSVIDLTMWKRKLREVAVAIPKEMRLLDASGNGIGETREEESGSERIVKVALTYDAEGTYQLTLAYEREMQGQSGQAPVPLVTVKDVERQNGFIAVAAAGSVEVTEGGALKDLATLDPSELPPAFQQMGQEPVLYAYRYIRVPYEGALSVTRHDDLEVKRSIVERAVLQSYFAREGPILTRATYHVRNNQKQFLKLELPDGAEVWSSYLSGKPVKAAKEGTAVLLPLEKAKASEEGARSFPVEVVYFQERSRMRGAGRGAIRAPKADLECLELSWELYLPEDLSYTSFGGDLERKEHGRVVIPPPPPPPPPQPTTVEDGERDARLEEQNRLQNERLSSNVAMPQGLAGAVAGGGQGAGEAKGVLPVRVDIPLEGVRVTLGKRVVKATEAPEVTFLFHAGRAPRKGAGLVFVLALVWSATVVSVLRRGPDQVHRRQALLMGVLLLLTLAAYRYGATTPAPFVWGAAIPVLVFLGRALRAGPAAAALLAALLLAAGPARADDEPQPPPLQDTEMAIPWSDMKRLMEQIMAAQKPVKEPPPPPVPYAITRAAMTGEASGDGKTATFSLALDLQVMEAEAWVTVPVGGADLAVSSATLDGAAAPLTSDGSQLNLLLRGAGTHRFDATFSVAVSQSGATRSLWVRRAPASVSQLTFTVPQAGVEVTPGRGVVMERRDEGAKTVAVMALDPGDLGLSWQPKKDDGPSQVEGKVQAEVKTLVTIGEGVVSGLSLVELKLFQKKVSRVRVALPADVTLLDASLPGARDTKDEVKDGKRIVTVELPFEAEASVSLSLSYEKALGGPSGKASIPVVEVLDVDRQNGHIGLAARSNVEIAESGEPKELSPLDPSELPADLTARSPGAILQAYRYIKLPYELEVVVTRHEDLAVMRSIIVDASFTRFHGKDGHVLTQALYALKNNQKQFLRVTLPPGAEVWSTFLAGRAVKAAKDASGAVLVPLQKSKLGVDNMKPFSVELVYHEKERGFFGLGRRRVALPATDVECLRTRLTTYLPEEYAVYGFGGKLEGPELSMAGADMDLAQARFHTRVMPKPSGPVGAEREGLESFSLDGDKQADAPARQLMPSESVATEAVPEPEPSMVEGTFGQDFNQDVEVAKDEIAQKNLDLGRLGGYAYNQAAMKAGAARGVLPVRIEVPREGQSFTFGTTVVKHGEAPDVTFWYLSRDLRSPLELLLFLASALFSALAISTIKASSFQALSGTRAGVMGGCLAVVALVRFFAQGSPYTILWGALLPVAVYVIYLMLRRDPERLHA